LGSNDKWWLLQQGCAGSKGSDSTSIKAMHNESGVKCLVLQPLLLVLLQIPQRSNIGDGEGDSNSTSTVTSDSNHDSKILVRTEKKSIATINQQQQK